MRSTMQRIILQFLFTSMHFHIQAWQESLQIQSSIIIDHVLISSETLLTNASINISCCIVISWKYF